MVGIPLARLAQNQQEANQLVEVVGQKQRLDAHRDQRAIAVPKHGGALGIRFLRIQGLMAQDVLTSSGAEKSTPMGPAGDFRRLVAEKLGRGGIARGDEKLGIHKQCGRRIAQRQAHQLGLERRRRLPWRRECAQDPLHAVEIETRQRYAQIARRVPHCALVETRVRREKARTFVPMVRMRSFSAQHVDRGTAPRTVAAQLAARIEEKAVGLVVGEMVEEGLALALEVVFQDLADAPAIAQKHFALLTV